MHGDGLAEPAFFPHNYRLLRPRTDFTGQSLFLVLNVFDDLEVLHLLYFKRKRFLL